VQHVDVAEAGQLEALSEAAVQLRCEQELQYPGEKLVVDDLAADEGEVSDDPTAELGHDAPDPLHQGSDELGLDERLKQALGPAPEPSEAAVTDEPLLLSTKQLDHDVGLSPGELVYRVAVGWQVNEASAVGSLVPATIHRMRPSERDSVRVHVGAAEPSVSSFLPSRPSMSGSASRRLLQRAHGNHARPGAGPRPMAGVPVGESDDGASGTAPRTPWSSQRCWLRRAARAGQRNGT
jgi:hypothetical protein